MWADLGLAARLLDQPTASLSGGEAARAGLAALLLARFDVFLLDEPTNDLDLDGLDRLERWVGELPAAVVLVSHDRTFLARTITDVVELDEFTHRATAFGGGWQAFLDEREAARRAAWERFEEYDGERKALARRAQREREWAITGPVEGAQVRRAGQEHPGLQDQPDRAARRAGGPHRAGHGPPRGRRQAAGAVAAAVHGVVGRAQRRRRVPGSTARSSSAARSCSVRST